MSKAVLGVAAALLAGGGVLYGAYQLVGGGDGRGDAVADAEPSAPEAARTAARGGRGVPEGTEPMGFGEGADGERVTDAARARADEAAREAERLAMLGTGELDLTEAPKDGQPSARDDDRPRGLRDARPEGLPVDEPDADDDARPRGDADVDRLLAEIAARSGAERAAAQPDDASAGTGGPGSVAGRRFAANARLTDKPDRGGFTANRRQTDKPDEGGFVASADTQRFDPCEKADGTLYVGPGTALNPFAETDPCLPQATAQSYEVAALGEPDPAPVDVDAAAAPVRFVDVARPNLPAPPPMGVGSDYRG